MRSYRCGLGILLVAAAGGCSAGNDSGAADDSLGDTAGSGGAKAGGAIRDGGGLSGMGGAPGGGGTGGSGGAPGKGGASGTGGASGSGGVGGHATSNDGGLHTVGKCDGLGAVGQWEEISPISGNAPSCMNCQAGEGPLWGAVSVIAHPLASGTIYAAVWNGGIWKSTDCGASWTKTNTGAGGAIITSGVQFAMRLAPLETGAVLTDTLYVDNWLGTNVAAFKSTNDGVDWAPLYGSSSIVARDVGLGGWAQDVRFEPGDHQHLLLTFHANCTAPYNGGCIGESKDGGTTWALINGPLDQWSEGSSVNFITATTWLFGSHLGLFYSPNSGASWKQVAKSGGGGASGGEVATLSASGSYYLDSDQGILQSQDRQVWTLVPNSPPAGTVVGTGKTLYAGFLFTSGSIWSAPADNPSKWTAIAMPTKAVNGGSWELGYDADHHILYSANNHSGLWRMVTQ